MFLILKDKMWKAKKESSYKKKEKP